MDSQPMHLPMHNPLKTFDQGRNTKLSDEEINALNTVYASQVVTLRSISWSFSAWQPQGTDCKLHRGNLTVFDDGHFLFWGDVSSTDTNDQWRDVFFEFQLADGRVIRVGSYSYQMEDRQCTDRNPCRWMIQTAPDAELAAAFGHIQTVGMKAGGFIGPDDPEHL